MKSRSKDHVAIVTASPPGERGVGQIYIRHFIEACRDCKVSVFGLLRPEEEWGGDSQSSLNHFERLDARYEYASRGALPALGNLRAKLGYLIMTRKYASKLADEITRKVRALGVRQVVVVTESPLLILMAEQIARSAGLPVHAIVWDHPKTIASNYGHTGWSLRSLSRCFDSAVRRMNSIITVAPSLQRRLKQINPDAGVELFRCPVPHQENNAERHLALFQSDSPFVVGFAGSVTAPDELETFLAALDSIQWRVGDRPVVLRLFGLRFTFSAKARRNIEYRGFLPSSDDVVAELGDCDVNFLPQPFAEEQRELAEFSYPTKLSSYLSSGRPCLIFAPEWGSLFTETGGDGEHWGSAFGFQCNQSDPRELARLIGRIASDANFYLSGCERAIETGQQHFSTAEAIAAIDSILGVDHAGS